MSEKQKLLLKTLALTMFDLAEEATNDDDFNEQLAGLGIFNMSIDEGAMKITDIVNP